MNVRRLAILMVVISAAVIPVSSASACQPACANAGAFGDLFILTLLRRRKVA